MIMEHLSLTFGAISGCHAWGKSSEAALSELVYVFEMIQEEYQDRGETLPEDTD
ncbi:hypothetical protein PL11201_550047 [Planktothrix sp. PCC 11201]|nr:hypothetical protein PL11201_550047 [Planktothrix sp. PCC 11201]